MLALYRIASLNLSHSGPLALLSIIYESDLKHFFFLVTIIHCVIVSFEFFIFFKCVQMTKYVCLHFGAISISIGRDHWIVLYQFLFALCVRQKKKKNTVFPLFFVCLYSSKLFHGQAAFSFNRLFVQSIAGLRENYSQINVRPKKIQSEHKQQTKIYNNNMHNDGHYFSFFFFIYSKYLKRNRKMK